jgi:hypothetical protein
MMPVMTQSDSPPDRAWFRRPWVIAAIIAACAGLYVATLRPANEGPWREDHARSAYAELSGRNLTVHNIRNFRYENGQAPTERTYLSKTWQLDELVGVWFGLSHFGPFGMAHSFLSFEFSDGEFLVLSIEARLRPDQAYNPLAGLFRQYPKIYIVATEPDVIGVRSHQRGETVLLYPINDTPEKAVQALLTVLNDANDLLEAPGFYNTLLDNCLTNLLKHSANFANVSAADIRVLLPGHTDRLTYAFGITPDDIPFEAARRRAKIDPTLGGIDDPAFTANIRCGWKGYGGIEINAGCDHPINQN